MKQTKAELERLRGDVIERWDSEVKEEQKSRHSDTYPSFMLIEDAYTLSAAAFLLDGDTTGFVRHINTILQIIDKLYRRHCASESISLIVDWPIEHAYYFYALCINDIPFALGHAKKIDPERLQPMENPHPFNVEFTSSLRLLLLDDAQGAASWIAKFIKRCQAKINAAYAGYAMAFQAINERDSVRFAGALEQIVNDYPKQTRSNGFFHSVAKALICFYGVGFVHLARHRGIAVNFEHALIPKALTDLPPHTYSPPEPPKKNIFNFLRF
jgi:hypothetical protein